MEKGHTSIFQKNQRGSAHFIYRKLGGEDKIIWDLKDVDFEGDWKTRAYVVTAMNLRVP